MENFRKEEILPQKNIESLEKPSEVSMQTEVVPDTFENITEVIKETSQEISQEKIIISDTTEKVGLIRQELSLSTEGLIPSNKMHEVKIVSLENKKAELEGKLNEILESDLSGKYKAEIDGVRQSKIDWASSPELARRLKLTGASEEDVEDVKNWLIDNATQAKSFVLSPEKFKNVQDVLSEMSGEENIKLGSAFHVPGGREDVPETIKSSIFLQEKPAKPPIPGQLENQKPTIDTTELNHEFGHVTQDGLLDSENYKEGWNPKFKNDAPDKEYIGLIHETDTRIRSMYNDLGSEFNPQEKVFGKKQLESIREKISKGTASKDTKDLLKHYDDGELIKMANRMPSI